MVDWWHLFVRIIKPPVVPRVVYIKISKDKWDNGDNCSWEGLLESAG
jgi:hypothetical protein